MTACAGACVEQQRMFKIHLTTDLKQLFNVLPQVHEKKKKKQAGAELCQAQEKLGLVINLRVSMINQKICVVLHFVKTEIVFHLF